MPSKPILIGTNNTSSRSECEQTVRNSLYSTYSYVNISGLSALEVIFSEEVSELGLDAAQRLGVPMKQQHHVHHGEALTHQGQQVTKEPCQDESQFISVLITITIMVKGVNHEWKTSFRIHCKNVSGF